MLSSPVKCKLALGLSSPRTADGAGKGRKSKESQGPACWQLLYAERLLPLSKYTPDLMCISQFCSLGARIASQVPGRGKR